MRIFGLKLKGRSGYSYTSAAYRRGFVRTVERDLKSVFAEGVELGRMLVGEKEKPARKQRRKR